jgi:hypothetical protein
MSDSYIDTLQIDLDRLGEWARENATKINPGKSKAVGFTRDRVKDPPKNQRIPEASGCKYLGIIFRNDLSWADKFSFTYKKP